MLRTCSAHVSKTYIFETMIRTSLAYIWQLVSFTPVEACDEEVTPPPRPKVCDDDLRSGTPPSKIVTPFAKLQLAAWKRAEAATKGESHLQNMNISSFLRSVSSQLDVHSLCRCHRRWLVHFCKANGTDRLIDSNIFIDWSIYRLISSWIDRLIDWLIDRGR